MEYLCLQFQRESSFIVFSVMKSKVKKLTSEILVGVIKEDHVR